MEWGARMDYLYIGNYKHTQTVPWEVLKIKEAYVITYASFILKNLNLAIII
jgi:hypothetical protein